MGALHKARSFRKDERLSAYNAVAAPKQVILLSRRREFYVVSFL
jgi:hypothetical protein